MYVFLELKDKTNLYTIYDDVFHTIHDCNSIERATGHIKL